MVNVEQAENESASERVLPLLLLLFVASGCSALIYEIVWFQLLELVIGSSAVSLGILLGTFMGGLCLGSLALSRVVSARWHPLLVYGVLELGIGASAIAVLFGLPSVAGIYVAYAGYGLGEHHAAQRDLRPASIASDRPDGRNLARHRAVGREFAEGRILVGNLVHRKYRRRGVRLPARRILPAEGPRHGGCNLCRGDDQCCAGGDRLRPGRGDRLPGACRSAARR